MSTWFVEVEITIPITYKKLIPIERYDMWEPSDIGSLDPEHLTEHLFTEAEEKKVFDQQDQTLYKDRMKMGTPEFEVLKVHKERINV